MTCKYCDFYGAPCTRCASRRRDDLRRRADAFRVRLDRARENCDRLAVRVHSQAWPILSDFDRAFLRACGVRWD